MTVQTFHLPDLGEGLMEAEIVEWHVRPGERVRSGQPLLSVETDKAVVEIPSPRSATVAALHGAPGDLIEIGAPLVDFEADAADAGAVVGSLETAEPSAAASRPAARQPTPGGHPPEAVEERTRASPRARRRARELGVDLDTITATGGVIRSADVENAAAAGPATSQGGAMAGSPAVPRQAGQGLRGVRRAMARRMADAHARVASASVTEEADVSAWSAGQKPMLRLVRAVVRGCRALPMVNALFDDTRMTLAPQESVNLGIAMETEDGLFVPVIRDAQRLGDSGIAQVLEDMERQVRLRTAPPEALRGATITLSNFGAVAGLHAEMVVVPPQVAIVGAGRMFQRLTLDQGVPGTAPILPLSLTFDHRALTGVEACRFLAAMVQDLETPR